MKYCQVVVFVVSLCSSLAYNFNYPSQPEVNVICDDAQLQKYTRIGDKYYFIGASKATWFEAAHICRRYGGDLALIESSEEMKDISSYLEIVDKDGWYWISGNDLVTVNKFMSISNGLPLGFTSWSAGQPDNPGVEQCLHLWYRDATFRMNNWMCKEKAKYLCQRQNYTRCSDTCQA